MAAGLAIAAIISAILAAAGSATAAGLNYKAQKDTNAANAKAVKQTNAQAQYNTEHAHQIEMADLQAAGLNPVLTATGGSGAPMATLNSPKAVAPEVDLSGVSSAIQSMTHMMMMSQLVDAKVNAAEKSVDAKIYAANKNADAKITSAKITGNSRETVADKYIAAGRARHLYKNESAGKALISNSKQVKKLKDDYEFKSYADFLKWFNKTFKNR